MVIDYEKWRLAKAGRSALIKQIKWISKDKGDGAGYDILSKNEDGSDRYIEVKTTKMPKETPIYVTANEIAFADLHADRFYLYRIFDADSRKIIYPAGQLCPHLPTGAHHIQRLVLNIVCLPSPKTKFRVFFPLPRESGNDNIVETFYHGGNKLQYTRLHG